MFTTYCTLHRFALSLIGGLVFATASLAAERIDIKGLRIGMTGEEVHALFPSFKDFTIAGIRSRYAQISPGPAIEYRDGKLAGIFFTFASTDFDKMLSAAKEKYPELKCVTSKNSFGGRSDQTDCALDDGESMLVLVRYAQSADTSGLAVTSHRLVVEEVEKVKAKKNDF